MVKFLVLQHLHSRQARSIDALPTELRKLLRNLTEVRYKVESISKRKDERQTICFDVATYATSLTYRTSFQ